MKKTLQEQIDNLIKVSVLLLIIGTLTTYLITRLIVKDSSNKVDKSNITIVYKN